MSRRLPILITALTVPLLALVPALSAAAATEIVYDDAFGTVNYDGGGEWGVAAPSDPPWDRGPGALFAGLPGDGAAWTLDIEGKVIGTVATSVDGMVLTTVGYPVAGPDAAISQKVRFMYYVGNGAYPAIDAQNPTVADLFGADMSITGIWNQDPAPAVGGAPTMEMKIQNPATGQRVSLHSAGTGASAFTAASTTLDLSDPARNWRINSTFAPYSQYQDVTVQQLIDDLGTWELVSFGPNIGRGADGAFTLQAITALGTDFVFAGPRPVAAPPAPAGTTSATLPETGEHVSPELLVAGVALLAAGITFLALRPRRARRPRV